MATVFPGWQNANEGRAFPVHDEATKVDRAGILLPDDILVDAKIRIPRSLGQSVYIGSVGVTPALVSVSLVATEDAPFGGSSSSGASDQAVAVVTARRPVELYRTVAIQALQRGVGGWVTFGSGVNELSEFSAVFDSAEASLLAEGAASAYGDRPVESLQKEGSSTILQGEIALAGQAAVIRIRRVVRRVDGELKEMIAIGLDPSVDLASLLDRFSRPCNRRPSEGTCPGTPLTSINGVTPDEDGNIGLRLISAGTITDEASGATVDLPYGLTELCGSINLDSFVVDDLCESSSSAGA